MPTQTHKGRKLPNHPLTPRRSTEDLGPDLFATMLTDPAPVEPPHTNGAHHTGTEESPDAAGIEESEPT
ncbi:hypothetical protein [Salinispora mooreana]|uniref:hypothetical protein n=1 Tax=Salinispora mooreana TaxID=999545 RepID=UPI000370D8EE|nr:hypothetical protein [Salinispora mooreana]